MRPDLVVDYTSHGLLLVGMCDLSTATRLDGALRRWQHARGRWEIDTSMVSFADSHGLEPIAECIRRCRQLRRPEPRLTNPSLAVSRVLQLLDIAVEPFGLRAWDAALAATGRNRTLATR